MKIKSTFLPFIVSFALGFGFLDAGTLTFENKSVDVTMEPNATSTTIVFRFHNDTDEAVEIVKHAAPCSCISASFKDNKKIYLPGEKGELEATFNIGNFNGTVTKQVVVWQKGDAETEPSIILTAKITIPELLSVTPRTLTWNTNGKADPATLKIKVNHEEPIHITGVVSTNNNFRTELKTIEKGQEYELVITPLKTNETSFAILKITSDSKSPRYRLTQAFAYVRQVPSGE